MRQKSRAGWKPKDPDEIKARKQREGVALARFEHWLESYGSVAAARLDGIPFPERGGETRSQKPPSSFSLPNVSATYIDISDRLKDAAPVVRYLVLKQYVEHDRRDIRELIADWFGGELPRHILNGAEAVVLQTYKAWKLGESYRLKL